MKKLITTALLVAIGATAAQASVVATAPLAQPAVATVDTLQFPLEQEARRGRGRDDGPGHIRRGRGRDDGPNHS